MGAHQTAFEKAAEYVGTNKLLEITYKVPFGFHEFVDRKNISVEDFLRPTFQETHQVGLLHILLGCGVNLDSVIKTINKAIMLCDRVIVLEHNRDSADWDWKDDYLVKDHSLANCLSFYEFQILMELYGYESFRYEVLPGEVANDRNFIVEIFGKMPPYDFNKKYELPRRLNIPIFQSGIELPNFKNFYDVYVGTAESQIQFLRNSQIPIVTSNNILYANGGGFFSLNYIHLFKNIDLREIVLFDVNPNTIEFAKTVFGLIKKYPTLKEFLENYLLCNIADLPICQIKDSPWGDRLRKYFANYHLYNDVSDKIFKLILNGSPTPEGVIVYGLRNCADNRTDMPGILLLTSQADRFISENTLNVGRKGWAESDITYKETREVLKNVPLQFLVADISNLKPNPEDILIASNIFKGGFANKKDFNCTVLES